jgi:PAS domain S-box-containing protein
MKNMQLIWNRCTRLNDQGNVQEILESNVDVTERKSVEEVLRESYEKLQAQSEEFQAYNEELQAQSEELQEANGALRESEERFRTMANAIPQLAWISRADGYIYWYNDRWYTYTGTTPEQMEGWGWQSICDPAVLPKVLEQWRASLVTGKPFDMELPLRGADGIFRPFLTRVLPLKDDKGQILQWFGTNTDITERKHAEKTLETTLQRFYAILSNMHGAILLVSEESYVEFANDTFCQCFNLSEKPADLVGITSSEMLRKIKAIYNDPDRAMALIKENVERGEPVFGEEVRFIGGRTFIRDFVPLSVGGKRSGRLWYHIDITERKKAEESLKKAHDTLDAKVKERTAELEEAYKSLKESERSLSEAQRIAQIGSWDWDNVKNKMYRSDELCRIFRLDPHEHDTTYGAILNSVHPDDRNHIDIAIKQAFKGKPIDIDYRIILAEGEERIVHMNGGVTFNERCTPVRTRGTVQDITERKKAEEKLRESEEKYRNIVETTNEGILAIDSELKITFVNNQMTQMLGYNQEEMIGRPWCDFFDEEGKAFAKLNMKKRKKGVDEVHEFNYYVKMVHLSGCL